MKWLFKRMKRNSIRGFFCALIPRWMLTIGMILIFVVGGFPGELFYTGVRVCAEGTEELSLYATSAVLMDADSGRVLYEKNGYTPMAMASTTKIMTCIVVLENCNLEEMLTVSGYAASMPKVKLYIKKGENYTVKDLLYSLMLESHNDSAVALAEHVGKQYLPDELKSKSTAEYTVEESKAAVAAFADLMNRKAVELGCTDTWYITPNGLDAVETFTLEDGSTISKEHHTTAAELARVMAYCISESPCTEQFLEITRTANYSFSANGRSFSCANHNAFLNMMSGALSGKTGFTNKAGYCYVGALESDGRKFVVALLACGWPNNKSYKWSDTKELMQYGIEHYFYRRFDEEGTAFNEKLLQRIPVEGGQTNKLGETAYTDVVIVEERGKTDAGVVNSTDFSGEVWAEGLLLREDEEIMVSYSQKKQLYAPVEAGTLVGSVEYSVDGKVYKSQKIITTDSVKKIDLQWCFLKILERFSVLQ